MVVRSGRLLPSVIVGALVTGALTLGAGTASADPITDLLGSTKCLLDNVPTLLGDEYRRDPVTNECERISLPVPQTGSGDTGGETADSSPGGIPIILPSVPEIPGNSTGTPSESSENSGDGSPAVTNDAGNASEIVSNTAASTGGPAQAAVPAPSGVQAPDVRAGLLTPAVSAPGGLAARVPALGFGTVDPRLLMVPTGSPLRTLTGVTPGSPVTTSSDVQAMALDGLPSGLGTPAVLGVLILSTLAGFALRHRVLRRVRLAAAPEPESAG